MNRQFLLILPFTILLLSACGGGGSSSSGSAFVPVSASERYTGLRHQATLTEDNGMLYVWEVFGTGMFDVDNGIAARSQAHQKSEQGHTIQTRSIDINETEQCAYAGTVKIAGSVDEDTRLGVLTVTMNQCQTDAVTIMNGSYQLKLDVYDSSTDTYTAYTTSMDNVSINYQGKMYRVSGMETYRDENGIKTYISNTHRVDPQGKGVLFENITLVDRSLVGEGLELTGRIYLDEHGYVDLSTQENFRLSYSNGLPYKGRLKMLGNTSEMKVTAQFGYRSQGELFIELDADNNMTYESLATYNTESNWNNLPDFAENQAPEISLKVSGANWLDDGRNAPIVIDAFLSSDPEGTELSYEWVISSSPDGSSPQLDLWDDVSNSVAELTTDTAGDYVVSVTATDTSGMSATKSTTINICETFDTCNTLD